MNEQGRLTCQRCLVRFPHAKIIKCQKLIPGGMTMCSSCHKRFHPTCDTHVSVIKPGDLVCGMCLIDSAVYVCPQCSDEKKIVQLCERCEKSRHSELYVTHRDHIKRVLS